MIPILFERNEQNFETHGLGDLVDCISCETEFNSDGEWELNFQYPRTGILFEELTIGRFILAKANHWQRNQLFRIYGYGKEINGIATINCQHVSYDLNRLPVKKFKIAPNPYAYAAIAAMISNTVYTNDLNISKFTFYSDINQTPHNVDGYFKTDSPSTVRAVLLDGDSSIKGQYGGDLYFDNYDVWLVQKAGENRGVLIEYGIDMMDINQEENISEMYTGVLPYFRYSIENPNAQSSDDNERITYGSIQYASGSFPFHRVKPLDLTEYFPNQPEHTSPSAAALDAKAREWINAEDGFGEPEINLTVSYANLGQDVRLHDQVTVRFPKMGIDVAAKVTSYKYDVLKERAIQIQVGKTKKSILFSLEDASRLKKGLLPPKRIQNKSLTNDKYADGSVSSEKIGSGEVKEKNLDEDSVTEKKVKDSAITVNKIQDGAINTYKLQDNAVTGIKVLDQQISMGKLSNDLQITIADIIATQQLYADVIVFGTAEGTLVDAGHIVVHHLECGVMDLFGTGSSGYRVTPVHVTQTSDLEGLGVLCLQGY